MLSDMTMPTHERADDGSKVLHGVTYFEALCGCEGSCYSHLALIQHVQFSGHASTLC